MVVAAGCAAGLPKTLGAADEIGGWADAAVVAAGCAAGFPKTLGAVDEIGGWADAAAVAAGDAATAAQESADAALAAVTDLGLKVTGLISALRAQITSLTNLIVKIQKKVKRFAKPKWEFIHTHNTMATLYQT